MMDWAAKNRAVQRRTARDSWTSTEAEVLEQTLKVIGRTADPSEDGNTREAFGAWKIARMRIPEKIDNKSNIAVMK